MKFIAKLLNMIVLSTAPKVASAWQFGDRLIKAILQPFAIRFRFEWLLLPFTLGIHSNSLFGQFVLVGVGDSYITVPPSVTLALFTDHAEIRTSWDLSSYSPTYQFYAKASDGSLTTIQNSYSATLTFAKFQNYAQKEIGVSVTARNANFKSDQTFIMPAVYGQVVTSTINTADDLSLVALPWFVDLRASLEAFETIENYCDGQSIWIPFVGSQCLGTEVKNRRTHWEFSSADQQKLRLALYRLRQSFNAKDVRDCANSKIVETHSYPYGFNVNGWVKNNYFTQLDWHFVNGFGALHIYPAFANQPRELAHTAPGMYVGPGVNWLGFDYSEAGNFDWMYPYDMNRTHLYVSITNLGMQKSANKIAGTIAHEITHQMGYSHFDYVEGGGTRDDPPYAIGDCITSYLDTNYPN